MALRSMNAEMVSWEDSLFLSLMQLWFQVMTTSRRSEDCLRLKELSVMYASGSGLIAGFSTTGPFGAFVDPKGHITPLKGHPTEKPRVFR